MFSSDADGWQIPIGLTASEAICIDDSDSEHGSDNNNEIICSDSDRLTRARASCRSDSSSHVPSSSSATSSMNNQDEDANVEKDDSNHLHQDDEAQQTPNATHENQQNVNPFACFAYKPTPNDQPATIFVPEQSNKHAHKKTKHFDQSTNPVLKKYKSSKITSKRDHLNPQYKPPEPITEECISKWHSFAISTDPIELQRFHVLIAARLHARCQEGTVRKAMDRLRSYFKTSEGLNPRALSKANPEEIAPILSSVLFGNAKAKQIVQAAQDIVRLGGDVPETNDKLQKIMGIGPALSAILSRVNSRDSYLPDERTVN